MENNGKWENLQLSFDDFVVKINDYAKVNNMDCIVKESGSTTIFNKYVVTITLPCQDICLINCWEKKSGLTISSNQGKNQILGKKICSELLSNIQQTKTSNKTFKTINKHIYDNIIQTIKNKYTITSDNISKSNTIISKVSHKACDITMTYYLTTTTLLLQGKTTILWEDIILDICGETNTDPNKIITNFLDTTEKLEAIQIKCDSGLLEKLAMSIIGDEAYKNNRILDNSEKKWLHTSIFFHFSEIEFEDYCHAVASSIKIIEGLLKRIFSSKKISFEDGFTQFETINGSSKHTLKREFHCHFDTDVIKHISDLYEFINKVRNNVFHDEGAGNKTMSREQSIDIFDGIIQLLKSTHTLSHKLFLN